MEKLMDYDSRPFKPGDLVECISDEMPEFYIKNWTSLDGISAGDRLVVKRCEENVPGNFAVVFDGKIYNHNARLFRLVEPPFRPGDIVECISNGCEWLDKDGIKVGDRLIVGGCGTVGVHFTGKTFIHLIQHFEIIERKDAVEPECPEESDTPPDTPPSECLDFAQVKTQPHFNKYYVMGCDPFDDEKPMVEKLPFPDEFKKSLDRMEELYRDVKTWSSPSERLESALKFLETSGDVLQALKIAAGL